MKRPRSTVAAIAVAALLAGGVFAVAVGSSSSEVAEGPGSVPGAAVPESQQVPLPAEVPMQGADGTPVRDASGNVVMVKTAAPLDPVADYLATRRLWQEYVADAKRKGVAPGPEVAPDLSAARCVDARPCIMQVNGGPPTLIRAGKAPVEVEWPQPGATTITTADGRVLGATDLR
jgi:hypothetical protein